MLVADKLALGFDKVTADTRVFSTKDGCASGGSGKTVIGGLICRMATIAASAAENG
jgi:hypothetical protein